MGVEIYDQIGRLMMDLEWLNRNWPFQFTGGHGTTHVRRRGLPVNRRHIQWLRRITINRRPYSQIAVQFMPAIDIFRRCQAVLGATGVKGHITETMNLGWGRVRGQISPQGTHRHGGLLHLIRTLAAD